MRTLSLILLFLPILFFSCQPAEQGKEENDLPPPQSWIEDRVGEARQRLQQSEVGQKLWQAIEAHGGLARWYANGPIKFHFNYQPLNGSTPRYHTGSRYMVF